MGLEIEHKFLVSNFDWEKDVVDSYQIRQFYLGEGLMSVRLRLTKSKEGKERALITVKAPHGVSSVHEFEYDIPPIDGAQMARIALDQKLPNIVKTRHVLNTGWEVDVFSGRHQGLILAELELESIGEHFDVPSWVDEEVTEDSQYKNIVMARS